MRSRPPGVARGSRFSLWLWASLAVASTGPAGAHVGGEIARPVFLAPTGFVDGPTELTWVWNDTNEDPTGTFEFYVSASGVPPIGDYVLSELGGTKVADVAVSDEANALTLPTAPFGPGVWHSYALTVDPPLCPQLTPAPGVVVVRDGGATPLGAMMVGPPPPIASTDTSVTAQIVAIAAETPTVTLEAGALVPVVDGPAEDPCSQRQAFELAVTLAEDAPMEPDTEVGAERYRLSVTWDVTDATPGWYVLRARVSAGDSEQVVFSPGQVLVVAPFVPPEPESEVGPEVGEDVAVADVAEVVESDGDADAGQGGTVEVTTQPADGCAGGPGGRTAWLLAMMVLGVGLLRRTRS